ncbi:hypothetical protein [Mycolicibacterium mageritense]|uniref:hypothetical protein n=1 Tax=Mycolicibacterium mageritense TaxID=53462 RepID=UPI0011DA3C6F|nr:hypothetical protein [Mycolicibacterium mageritense]TXI56294.1 MAG: hypothetical protein E6Q55_29190 [Mycolicibacterium mageritense]
MRADPAGLAALAAKLTTTAATASAAIPAGLPHTQVAPDEVSAGVTTRLTTAANTLAANAATHIADLGELATRLSTIAATFEVQEGQRATAQSTLTASPTRGDSQLPPPLVHPPVTPDVRPPLVPTPPASGEVVSAQYEAGSTEGAAAFTEGWSAAGSALHQASTDLTEAANWLPQVWRSTAQGAALTSVFTTRASTFKDLASQADNLSAQSAKATENFTTAQQAAPTVNEFATNRQNLQTAQVNNARTGGMFSSEVAKLAAQRGELERRALTAHSTYSTDSVQATEPYGTTGEETDPTAGGPGNTEEQPGDLNSAAIDPVTGLPVEEALPPDGGPGLDDPALAQMLPMLLSTLVGGVGGLMGGLVQPLTSIPQQLLSAGTSALGGVTQAASAAAKDFDAPEIPDISAEGLPDVGGVGGGGGGGDTAPAAGLDTMPPVAGAGPFSAPAAAPAASAGAVPTTATSGTPGMGGPMGPMMPPMGGAPGAGGAGGDKDKKQQTKVGLRDLPNTEPVSGEIEERDVQVAGGSSERVPVPQERRRTEVYRITEPER